MSFSIGTHSTRKRFGEMNEMNLKLNASTEAGYGGAMALLRRLSSSRRPCCDAF